MHVREGTVAFTLAVGLSASVGGCGSSPEDWQSVEPAPGHQFIIAEPVPDSLPAHIASRLGAVMGVAYEAPGNPAGSPAEVASAVQVGPDGALLTVGHEFESKNQPLGKLGPLAMGCGAVELTVPQTTAGPGMNGLEVDRAVAAHNPAPTAEELAGIGFDIAALHLRNSDVLNGRPQLPVVDNAMSVKPGDVVIEINYGAEAGKQQYGLQQADLGVYAAIVTDVNPGAIWVAEGVRGPYNGSDSADRTQHGSSGGAVANVDGQLIGMTEAIVNDDTITAEQVARQSDVVVPGIAPNTKLQRVQVQPVDKTRVAALQHALAQAPACA